MATYVSIDSFFRNFAQDPNPADFLISASETQGWTTENRTTKSVQKHCDQPECPPLYQVTLLELSIPYDSAPLLEPYLYVEFSETNGQTTGLINTMGNTTSGVKLKNALFQVFYEKIAQINQYVLYNCHMHQVMKINPRSSYRFRVFDRTGKTIIVTDPGIFPPPVVPPIPPATPSPTSQVTASIEIKKL